MKKSILAEPLAWTGERLVPTCHRPLVYEHLHRYAVACGLAQGKRVLDIACGEGYGANLLAEVASTVTAVDIDAETIAHAKSTYRHRNLHFLQGSCTEIPCEDHSIDLIASFETIEHISAHDQFLREIKRVLTLAGILVISSPHKAEYRKISAATNPFHQAELNHEEFVKLIGESFKNVIAGKQRLVCGSWIAPDQASAKVATATFRGDFEGIEIENGVYRGVYSIAVCSDKPLPDFSLGVFENHRESADTWNMLDTEDTPADLAARLQQLAEVSDQLEERSKHVVILQRENEEKAMQIAHFQRDAEERSKHVVILQRENEEKAMQVAHFQRDAEERSKHVSILQRELEERTSQVMHFKKEVEENTRHVMLLQHENERLNTRLEQREERLARIASDAVDARWELLTLRGRLIREDHSAKSIQELESRVQAAGSERDQLRGMVTALQNELQTAQEQLEKAAQQMDHVRGSIEHRLILPFGRSQRKLRQLMAKGREHG